MKGLSIRLKVTLWYAGLMVLLVALTLAFIFAIGGRAADTSARNDLRKAVDDSLDEIDYKHGAPEVDDDLDFFSHGVYLSVYDRDGRLIYGRLPAEMTAPPPLAAGAVRTAAEGGARWHVYDGRTALKGYGDVWVRGVVSLSDAEKALQGLLTAAAVALPFLVLVAALGGYLLTARAFRPVRQIARAAERIGGGRDLSRRIDIDPGADELHTLAAAFNDMFDRLQRSFESERQFTSDASHELRTPVSVIIAHGEYALEHAGTLEEAKGALAAMLAQARKMSGLLSQLLTLARTDRGHQKLNLERVNASELAQAVAEEQREAARARGIDIRTDIQPDLWLQADETLLLRLLINLVSNAVTYGRPGGHVEVGLAREGGQIVGTVADDGIGIAPEHLPRIWERFYQVDPARPAGREGGAGLGLAMAKWIAEAHGGGIAASSEPGRGSVFTFRLPETPDGR